MIFRWPSLLTAALFAVAAVLATACGPSVKQHEAMEACHKQCGLALAGCYESRTCLEIDGQIVPCEEECESENEACENACTGE